MDLAIHDIELLVEELCAYHAIYSPLLQRREQRQAAHTYLQGLLAPLPRKSIEPMVLAVDRVAPKAVRAMQSFISAGQWNVEWLPDDVYAARRRQCGIPSDLPFKTKPALAQEMLAAVLQSQALRCRWVVADEAFGGNPSFLDGVAGLGLWYCAEVPHTTRVWGERPATHVPPWRGRGRRPQRERLVDGVPQACPVLEVAATLSTEAWTRQTIKEGSQGPMVAAFAALRVLAVRDTLPGPEVWLVLRRHLETGELKTYLRNAPVDTALEALVRMSGRRWPIATCCEDGKQLLGIGDDEVRSWTGWHHHMTLGILAHFFVVHMSLRLKKKPQQ
jgi:SRSO17 transposase